MVENEPNPGSDQGAENPWFPAQPGSRTEEERWPQGREQKIQELQNAALHIDSLLAANVAFVDADLMLFAS